MVAGVQSSEAVLMPFRKVGKLSVPNVKGHFGKRRVEYKSRGDNHHSIQSFWNASNLQEFQRFLQD